MSVNENNWSINRGIFFFQNENVMTLRLFLMWVIVDNEERLFNYQGTIWYNSNSTDVSVVFDVETNEVDFEDWVGGSKCIISSKGFDFVSICKTSLSNMN